ADSTAMTLSPPLPVSVVSVVMFPRLWVVGRLAAHADAARASATAGLRSFDVTFPVTLKSEWMSRVAVGSMKRFPWTVDLSRVPVSIGPAPTSPMILVAPSLMMRLAPLRPRMAKVSAKPRLQGAPVKDFGHMGDVAQTF